MKLSESKNVLRIGFLFISLIGSMVSLSLGSQSSNVIPSLGSVRYLPQMQITVDFSKAIAVNNLSLGGMLDWEWKSWLNSPALRGKAALANFRLIRLFDFRIRPCVYWNESSGTGVYNWTVFDALVQSIVEVGAEPMITLGYYDYKERPIIPSGMTVNPDTGLPYPESFGAYAADLVKHFKDIGLRVRYWEIWNEPWSYFFEKKVDGSIMWGVTNELKLKAFVELFNAASKRMREVDLEVLLGTDASLIKSFLNYFVQYGEGVGFLSFHKYDSWGTWLYAPEGYLSDEEILRRAERIGGDKWTYTPQEASQLWYETLGADLPVVCSETNLNSAWRNGTDPRIQQIIGTVWYAEMLRTCVLSGVRYSIYYSFASNGSPWWNTTKQTRGFGFGMVNMTQPNEEWYPYLVNCLLGNHLGVGDVVYYAFSSNFSSTSILAWMHNGEYKILINNKVTNATIVKLQFLGIEENGGVETTIYRVHSSERKLQIENTSFSNTLNILMKGYGVVLLSVHGIL